MLETKQKNTKAVITATVRRQDDMSIAYTIKTVEDTPGVQYMKEVHYFDRAGNCVDDDPMKALDHYESDVANSILENHKQGMKRCSQPLA